jgi:hypothetical protein
MQAEGLLVPTPAAPALSCMIASAWPSPRPAESEDSGPHARPLRQVTRLITLAALRARRTFIMGSYSPCILVWSCYSKHLGCSQARISSPLGPVRQQWHHGRCQVLLCQFPISPSLTANRKRLVEVSGRFPLCCVTSHTFPRVAETTTNSDVARFMTCIGRSS